LAANVGEPINPTKSKSTMVPIVVRFITSPLR